jgi:hypothetical protein
LMSESPYQPTARTCLGRSSNPQQR